MQVLNVGGNVVVKAWTDYVEASAMEQARNLASLPFVYKHVALMPDVHAGYGMPIGGVVALKGAVIPFCVGSDIACGMGAVRTSLTDIDTSTLKDLMSLIRRDIPVGRNWHEKRRYIPTELSDAAQGVTRMQLDKARYQLGTLGGGNHFIEIQRGDDGYIWIMVHSGSRNVGKQVADYYDAVAKDLNEKYHSEVPKSWNLAFLPENTKEYKDYLCEMNWCVDFAFYNRGGMLDVIMGHMQDLTGCEFDDLINIAHNYAAMEHHFGKNVLVHRKGATRAYEDELGIIPGSQGSKSYIVRGLGNPESFMSCSHGAGRKMGRAAARRDLDLEEEVAKLDEQGILHSIRGVQDLDEASGAYKSIDEVMANQMDLVEIVTELTPLAVVKG